MRWEKGGAGIQTAHFPLGSIRPSHYGEQSKLVMGDPDCIAESCLLSSTPTELYNFFGGKCTKIQGFLIDQ